MSNGPFHVFSSWHLFPVGINRKGFVHKQPPNLEINSLTELPSRQAPIQKVPNPDPLKGPQYPGTACILLWGILTLLTDQDTGVRRESVPLPPANQMDEFPKWCLSHVFPSAGQTPGYNPGPQPHSHHNLWLQLCNHLSWGVGPEDKVYPNSGLLKNQTVNGPNQKPTSCPLPDSNQTDSPPTPNSQRDLRGWVPPVSN